MVKTHWAIRLVRLVAILFVLFACLMVFIYTPFYSKLIVKALNYFVPVEVNQVAAKSQQQAALSEHDNLEPGSNLWIARQAYLSLIEEALNSKDPESLGLLQTRYKLLQDRILEQQKQEETEDEDQEKPAVPLLKASVSEPEAATSEVHVDEPANPLIELNSSENKALMQQYVEFLKKHPVSVEHEKTN